MVCNEPANSKINTLGTVFKYLKDFYSKEFNWLYFFMVMLLLGGLIYLNYWHQLEKKYVAISASRWARFCRYYLMYLVPFATAFLLQLLFYKDCHYYKNGWFWCILLLAPAFFAFRVNFNWQVSWILHNWKGPQQTFYLYSINWVVRVFVLLIPVLIIWLIKDKTVQPFYGAKALESVKPYLLMLLIMVPVIFIAGTQPDFLEMYPKAKVLNTSIAGPLQQKWRYVVFELCYGFDFVSIEFFFRGFLILALLRICGMHCIIPVACFYCTIHLGKPMAEAISSFFGGALLGIVAFNTGSIWGGLIVHLGIAWMMEAAGWLGALLHRAKP